jgi:hypothetical protein
MVFTIFSCLFVKVIQIKVFACFYEITHYRNSEIPFSNPLQGACSGFLITDLDPEIVP